MFKESLKIFLGDLKNAFKDLLPIIIVVALFQGVIIQSMPENVSSIVIGLTIVAVGLARLELGIFPIGEGLAVDFARKGSVTILHGKNIGLKEKKVFVGLTLEDNIKSMI
jgi:hypothetical protein